MLVEGVGRRDAGVESILEFGLRDAEEGEVPAVDFGGGLAADVLRGANVGGVAGGGLRDPRGHLRGEGEGEDGRFAEEGEKGEDGGRGRERERERE